MQRIPREIDGGMSRRSSEMTVNRTHHRPISRCLALTALFVAPLLSGACAEEKQQSADARRAASYGTGIVSMETVQKAMAMNRRAAEEAAKKAQEPPPVEVSAPEPEVPVAPRPRTRAKAQTLAHAASGHQRGARTSDDGRPGVVGDRGIASGRGACANRSRVAGG